MLRQTGKTESTMTKHRDIRLKIVSVSPRVFEGVRGGLSFFTSFSFSFQIPFIQRFHTYEQLITLIRHIRGRHSLWMADGREDSPAVRSAHLLFIFTVVLSAVEPGTEACAGINKRAKC
jgi:hypothetical protein